MLNSLNELKKLSEESGSTSFTKINGGIFYGLLVFFPFPEVLDRLLKLGLEPIWYMSEPLGAVLLGFAESLEDVELLNLSFARNTAKNVTLIQTIP